jgi:transposase
VDVEVVKEKERALAIEMRSEGLSIEKISRVLGVSKGSVSVWVRGVELTHDQKKSLLHRNSHKMSEETKQKMSQSHQTRYLKMVEDNPVTHKICPECGLDLPIQSFYLHKGLKSGLKRPEGCCKKCHSKKEKLRMRKMREMAFENLGGAICQECGCDEFDILEINHINGDGYIERTTRGNNRILYDVAYKRCDLTKYNVLCKVCNIKHYVSEVLGIKGHKISWNV